MNKEDKLKETIKNELTEKNIKRLYYKNWRDNNKDKIKKHNKIFWEKKAKEYQESLKLNNEKSNN